MFPTLPKLTMRLNDNIIDEDNNNEGVPYEIKTGIKSYKNLYGNDILLEDKICTPSTLFNVLRDGAQKIFARVAGGAQWNRLTGRAGHVACVSVWQPYAWIATKRI